jgi:hypothetical protein
VSRGEWSVSCSQSVYPLIFFLFSSLEPDFVVRNPKEAPVWELTAAELIPSTAHTSGVSLRAGKFSRVREDKNWETHTNLQQLRSILNQAPDEGTTETIHEIRRQTKEKGKQKQKEVRPAKQVSLHPPPLFNRTEPARRATSTRNKERSEEMTKKIFVGGLSRNTTDGE